MTFQFYDQRFSKLLRVQVSVGVNLVVQNSKIYRGKYIGTEQKREEKKTTENYRRILLSSRRIIVMCTFERNGYRSKPKHG